MSSETVPDDGGSGCLLESATTNFVVAVSAAADHKDKNGGIGGHENEAISDRDSSCIPLLGDSVKSTRESGGIENNASNDDNALFCIPVSSDDGKGNYGVGGDNESGYRCSVNNTSKITAFFQNLRRRKRAYNPSDVTVPTAADYFTSDGGVSDVGSIKRQRYDQRNGTYRDASSNGITEAARIVDDHHRPENENYEKNIQEVEGSDRNGVNDNEPQQHQQQQNYDFDDLIIDWGTCGPFCACCNPSSSSSQPTK